MSEPDFLSEQLRVIQVFARKQFGALGNLYKPHARRLWHAYQHAQQARPTLTAEQFIKARFPNVEANAP